MGSWRSDRWILPALIIGLGSQCALFGFRPVLSYRAIELGADSVEIGILAASFALLPVFLALPLGRLIDARGGRTIAMLGGAISLASYALFIFVETFFLLVVLNVVVGVGQLAVALSVQSFIGSGSQAQSRDRAFAQFSLATSLGHIAGPVLATYAGTVGESMGVGFFGVAFLFCTACQLVAFVPVFAFPRVQTGGGLGKEVRRSLGQILAVRGMKTSALASLVALATLDLLMVYLPLWASSREISVVTVGWLLSVRGIASLASRLLLPAAVRRLGHVVVAAISTLVSAVAIGALAMSNLPMAYCSMVLLGLGLGLMQPLTMAWAVSLATPGTIAVALGIRLSGNRAGQVIVPLAVAPLSAVVARPADLVFLLSGGLLLVSSLASALLARKTSSDD